MAGLTDAAWLARRRFRAQRADYYEYLGSLMEHGDGRKTLHDIFEDDARRYGRSSLRGRLSARWAERFRESGGNLEQTFRGTLPDDDVALLRASQLAGAGALGTSLYDVAETARLLDRAKSGFLATMMAAGMACCAMLLVLIATPLYTVPQLRKTFAVVPAEYWGKGTRALFGLADMLHANLGPALLALALTVALSAWSLPALTGVLRSRLDEWSIWRLYRDFHSIRFLALLGTMARQRGNVATPLRDALLAQLPGASAWKAWHLNRMLMLLDDGVVGAETFDTGLLDRETQWFLADMMAIHGVDAGLARTRQRIEARIIVDVLRRAQALRWTILLLAVGVLLGMTLWHFSVIDELRRAMQAYYAAR